MSEKLLKMGEYNPYFNQLLGINIQAKEIFRSKGLPAHMIKRRHEKCLKYIDYIPEIILNPDYVGVNPNEENSLELIKCYKDNILIGLKIELQNNYLYVATMHDIQDSKIERRLHSGRIKKVVDNLPEK